MEESNEAVPAKVRCVDCGFLSWRRHGEQTSPHYEVTTESRKTGTCPSGHDMVGVTNHPHCFRRKLLMSEYESLPRDNTQQCRDSFLEVIKSDRPCRLFTQYQECMNPEEHMIMYQSIEVAKIAAASRIKDMEREDRNKHEQWIREDKIRTDIKTAEDERGSKQKKEDRRNKFIDKLWTFALAVVGWLGSSVVACFVGLYYIDKKPIENTMPTITQPTTTAPVPTK